MFAKRSFSIDGFRRAQPILQKRVGFHGRAAEDAEIGKVFSKSLSSLCLLCVVALNFFFILCTLLDYASPNAVYGAGDTCHSAVATSWAIGSGASLPRVFLSRLRITLASASSFLASSLNFFGADLKLRERE